MQGRRTVTWSYLRMVNEQLRVFGPLMRPLQSTGMYFTAPPDAALAPLPGELIESVSSATPVMVGEFAHKADGSRYAMLVNLGLDRSSEIRITLRAPYAAAHQISPVDRSLIPVAMDDSFWLTAGQGVLLKLESR
jgi:hypothetical protein